MIEKNVLGLRFNFYIVWIEETLIINELDEKLKKKIFHPCIFLADNGL